MSLFDMGNQPTQQQPVEDVYYDQQPQQQPQPYAQQGRIFSNSREQNDFLKGIYSYDDAVNKLVHYWNGDDKDDQGDWIVNDDLVKAKMNKKGVNWCKHILMTFCGGQFIMTSFKSDAVNKRMRKISHNINHELHARFVEFGFHHPLDIEETCWLIMYTIEAVFNGTLGDAHRGFMSRTTQQTLIESKDMNQRGGIGRYFGFGGGNAQAGGV
jgi:hypothetical protein